MTTFPKLGPVQKLSGQGGCYCGRRGLPREWVLQMYADYQRLGSLAKAGRLHNRTRQNMFGIFQTAGLKLNARTFLPAMEYKGRNYTAQKICGRHRYLRCTVGRRGAEVYLHRVIWQEAHGPIPPGHKVAFKDGNHLNVALENLELLTNSEQARKYATKGQNQFTVNAKERLDLLLRGIGARSAQLKARAA